MISFDYMNPKSEDGKDRGIDSLPILVGIDRRHKYHSATMVPNKGCNAHAIRSVVREIDLAGYNRLIIKSDQEPAILDLLRAAKRERAEDIEIQPEESPVGEHQSNGDIERAVQAVEGQIRCMILSLESRYKSKIRQDHPIFPWLIRHSAILLNIAKVGDDGKTAYERRKGKRFLRAIPEIGECIWFLRPESVGKDKLDTR